MKVLLISCPNCHDIHEVTIDNTWVDDYDGRIFKARWTDDDGRTRDHLLKIEDYKLAASELNKGVIETSSKKA